MAFRDDKCDLVLGLIIWLGILSYIREKFSWSWLLFILASIGLVIIIFHIRDKKKLKRDQQIRESAPCKHGVVGADYKPQLCTLCLKEKEQYEEERSRQKALRKQQAEEQRRQFEWWRALDGRQFEEELNILLRQLGYNSTLTPYSGDGGVDIVINEKENNKIIVQCKAHHNYISPGVVRELYGTMIHEKASEGWIVTTSGFYSGARVFAHNKPIRLFTIKDLLREKSKLDIRSSTDSNLPVHSDAPKGGA